MGEGIVGKVNGGDNVLLIEINTMVLLIVRMVTMGQMEVESEKFSHTEALGVRKIIAISAF